PVGGIIAGEDIGLPQFQSGRTGDRQIRTWNASAEIRDPRKKRLSRPPRIATETVQQNEVWTGSIKKPFRLSAQKNEFGMKAEEYIRTLVGRRFLLRADGKDMLNQGAVLFSLVGKGLPQK